MGDSGCMTWGHQLPEAFTFSPNHILGTPTRDVYFGKAVGGYYITSHIYFQARNYRCRYRYRAEILNIFGMGNTLKLAIENFEKNFTGKVYNIQQR